MNRRGYSNPDEPGVYRDARGHVTEIVADEMRPGTKIYGSDGRLIGGMIADFDSPEARDFFNELEGGPTGAAVDAIPFFADDGGVLAAYAFRRYFEPLYHATLEDPTFMVEGHLETTGLTPRERWLLVDLTHFRGPDRCHWRPVYGWATTRERADALHYKTGLAPVFVGDDAPRVARLHYPGSEADGLLVSYVGGPRWPNE